MLYPIFSAKIDTFWNKKSWEDLKTSQVYPIFQVHRFSNIEFNLTTGSRSRLMWKWISTEVMSSARGNDFGSSLWVACLHTKREQITGLLFPPEPQKFHIYCCRATAQCKNPVSMNCIGRGFQHKNKWPTGWSTTKQGLSMCNRVKNLGQKWPRESSIILPYFCRLNFSPH